MNFSLFTRSPIRLMIMLQYLCPFLLATRAATTASLLPADAMLPVHTPLVSTRLTIWDEPWEFIEPGEYEIELQPGYILREHFATIGKEFNRPQIFGIHEHIADPEINDFDEYMLRDPDLDDINLIRRDPKVKYIGLAVYVRAIDDAVEPERWAAMEARLEQEHLERDRIKGTEAKNINEQKDQRNEL